MDGWESVSSACGYQGHEQAVPGVTVPVVGLNL
jgi:hypothetical protein